MSIVFAACTSCKGAKRVVNNWPEVALSPERTPVLSPHMNPDDVESFTVQTCSDCNGLRGPDGRTYARYRDRFDNNGQPYASASTLRSAITRSKGRVCKQCKGAGETARVAMIGNCSRCKATGQIVASFAPGDVLPESVDLYGSPASTKAWADAVEIIPIAGSGMSFNDSHLGLGSILSVTDYGGLVELGRANGVDAVIAKVREELGKGPGQWLNYADRQSRIVATRVVLTIHANGYTVKSAASLQACDRVLLPPAYTPEVLNHQID